MRISLLFMFIFCNFIAYSQPNTITYQGKLLNNNNLPVNQESVNITFTVYDAETSGNKVWPPNYAAASKTVDINQGLYSVVLGTGVGSDETFTSGIFNSINPWLELVVDGSTLPRTALNSVPFSLISDQLSTTGWASPGAIGTATPNSGAFSNLAVGNSPDTYIFPSSDGDNGQVLITNGSGSISWTTPYTGLTNFTESNYTYDSKTGVKLLANNADTDVDIVLQPKGKGAIIAHQPDGNTSGGDKRGDYAVDLQLRRDDASQVATGYYSTISGGGFNETSGDYSIISGGGFNEASGNYSIISGGEANSASAKYSVISGGESNSASGNYSVLSGGRSNSATGSNSIISGGFANSASGSYSIISGGRDNRASGNYSIISGGEANSATGSFSIISGGEFNEASGSNSIISGGESNSSSGDYSALSGGLYNVTSGDYSFVSGGERNRASGLYSAIIGGRDNYTFGNYSFVSGYSNTAQSYGETVIGLFAIPGDGSSVSRRDTDRLFVIGNGENSDSRSNALTMLKNGSFTSSTGASLTAGGVWTNASDKRLKEQIFETKYGLSTVLSLRPVDYKMIKDGSAQVGFIAQEVREIIPEVISGIEGDLLKGETLGISYGNLVPVLTKAIQEQQATIENLQKKLNSIKAELANSQNFNEMMLDKFSELTDKINHLLEEKQQLTKINNN